LSLSSKEQRADQRSSHKITAMKPAKECPIELRRIGYRDKETGTLCFPNQQFQAIS